MQELAWKGEPAEIVEAIDDIIIPPEYLLEPVIMAGIPSVIFGDKGVHKTTLCLLFAACVSLAPWDDNPLGMVTNCHSVKVAMLDWEADRKLTQYNVLRLRKGMDVPYFSMDYKRCRLPLVDSIEQISTFLEEKEIGLVIIDSLGAACGGDLFKPEPALKFFEALRSLNRTSLIIAQNAKNEENKRSIFGSTYFSYYSRNIFELRKSSDILDKDESSVALFHKESNYSGKADPIGFHFHFTRETIKVEREAVNYGEFADRVSRQKLLIELLKDGALSNIEIAQKLEISQGNVRILTKRLADKKQIVKTEGSKWGLLI